MEVFGLFAFAILLCYCAYPGRVKRLEATIKRLERKQRGENSMSKLISELVNKTCRLKTDDAVQLVGNTELECLVLDLDDEWIKVRFTDKKKKEITKLLRIENVKEIEEVLV